MSEQETEYMEVDTIELPMEDGTSVECAILDDFMVENKKYYALAAIINDEISEETWFYSYEEDGEDILVNNIDSDEELNAVKAAYEKLSGQE